MKDFLQVNRHKLLTQFLFSVVIACALLTFVLLNTHITSIKLISYFYLLSLPMALFIVAIGVLHDILEFRRTNNILNEPVFQKLSAFGFSKTYSDLDSKLFFSQPVLKTTIENFPACLQVEKNIPRLAIEFDYDNVTDEQREKLRAIIGKSKIENDWLGMTLVYPRKARKLLSPEDVNKDITTYINFLKAENIKPWPKQ